ncbi:hypothetical protein PAP_06490 [Palaeococcus pacificus DY20341]|uniref:Yip1 domain-containing protein n=2 Tax=Palaeococcus TaxID=83867 RepID=A0A075LSH6_9EURY|nr:hypothetical protein PAP_06490 [Palaeococcus pacificus DY20341]
MSGFWGYLYGAAFKPRSTFDRLLKDPRRLVHGFKAVLLISALYTLTVVGLAITHAVPVVPPWVAIPAEDYYFWEIFFTLPVFVMAWILAAGLVQLCGRVFNGEGTFEDTLAVLGFVLTVPMFVTWIPETVMTLLFLAGAITQRELLEMTSKPGALRVFASTYQLVALVWYLILTTVAVGVVQKLRLRQAAVVAVLTVLTVGFIMLIFIR